MNSPMRSNVSSNVRIRGVLAVALATAVAAAAPLEAAGVATPGHRAPAFVLDRPEGGVLSLARFAGHPLLINVFAAWCATCRVEEPLLVRAYAKYKGRVMFLGVDEQEGAARATAYARELRVPYPIALDDGPFAASYDTSKIPETILVDARGTVRAVYRGLVSARELDRTLALIAKKE